MGMFAQRDIPVKERRKIRAAARAAAEVCCVAAYLPIRVPTIGLHDKTYGHHDSPALRAAKSLYAKALPPLARPVAPPLCLAIDFVLTPPRLIERFDGVLPYTHPPDLSNLVKVIEDALRHRGWMTDDAAVVSHSNNKWVSFDPARQGVWVSLMTVQQARFGRDGMTPFALTYVTSGGAAAEHK